jgi:precorrin-8X/cobalt-precorrin-8 methylmutase
VVTAFDRYLAVDWSAANQPVGGKDSIWIGEAIRTADGVVLQPSRNPRTRAEAMATIEAILLDARSRGERVMVGFDFVFGYPAGAAEAMTGAPGWESLWQALADLVEDAADNRSNRFDVAVRLNQRLEGPYYWGHPHGRAYAGLAPTKPRDSYMQIAERRIAEGRVRGPQPVWKLTGVGSVGSQSMLGIARLQRLRTDPRFRDEIAIWPFETDFERNLARPIIVVEIYPSLLPPSPGVTPRDRGQVEACAARYAELDKAGRLTEILAPPAGLTDADRVVIRAEEGWIAGVGHEALLRERSTVPYLRDPDAIYAQSFATIRAEAELSSLPAALHGAAIRMIHACGMPDLAADIAGDPSVVEVIRVALAAGAPILCDCEMVRAGLSARYVGNNERIVTLNDPSVPYLAAKLATTRSAAAVELWRDSLAGAVVVIGNAPTALFHLLDLLAAGAPRPAAIIATPVGFVGAAESKERLIAEAPAPYLTVRGRRGGSAIASAALNAIAAGAP